MADYELVEERLISGTGVLRIPEDAKEFRHAYLLLDVIRFPSQRYLNLNWSPSRGKYAFLTFKRNKYVIDSAAMEFDRQLYETIADITSQTLIAVKCAYAGVLQTFNNFGLAMIPPVPPVSTVDLIKDYESLGIQWDEVVIKCYTDTAIQARLYAVNNDTCTPDRDKKKRPPPPPPPLPPVPPGTSIGDISPPYDSEDDPDTDTDPFPDDSSTPPPPPACTKLAVQIRYKVGGQEVNTTRGLYAPLGELTIGTYQAGGITNWGLGIKCRGEISGACQPNEVSVGIDGAVAPITDAVIVSYTVIP